MTFVDPDGEASIVAPYDPGLNRQLNAKIAAFINNAWLPKFAKSLLISMLHQPETRGEFAIEFSTTVLGFAGVIETGPGKSILKAGLSKSNYRKLFVESFPDMPKYYHVQHILPQKYELILSKAGINIHELKYLRGVRPEIHSKITKLWLGWEKSLGRTPAAKEIMSYAKEIERNFGKYFYK